MIRGFFGRGGLIFLIPVALLALVAVWFLSHGTNNVPRLDEDAKATWSEVLDQYQRPSDLIPNLVATVSGYAQEQQTLTAVIEARSKATQMQLPPDILTNPQAACWSQLLALSRSRDTCPSNSALRP
jgi:LemA protein